MARATGLEPATSGVTGRNRVNRHSRLAPGITGYSGDFLPSEPAVTGYDRLVGAWRSQVHNRPPLLGQAPSVWKVIWEGVWVHPLLREARRRMMTPRRRSIPWTGAPSG